MSSGLKLEWDFDLKGRDGECCANLFQDAEKNHPADERHAGDPVPNLETVIFLNY